MADAAEKAAALAEWLVERLDNSLRLDYIEEFYFSRLLIGQPFDKRLAGACGNVEDDTWLVFMVQQPSLLDRIFRRSMPVELHEQFITALHQEFSKNPEILDVEWYEEDSKLREFNHAARPFGTVSD
ncbi:hypothetical protein CW740_00220 [Kangiella profundi]|uniref:Uncharacterized protein n=1 Tax=Kangiella profundi TaxID=1561924 RepID=A0A2K9AJD7_9GAMM|nr:hypothetical protein [Kangiella profundi]AUD77742.1 hypothetical protein CW740_00220 [Kangiella profundi]